MEFIFDADKIYQELLRLKNPNTSIVDLALLLLLFYPPALDTVIKVLATEVKHETTPSRP